MPQRSSHVRAILAAARNRIAYWQAQYTPRLYWARLGPVSTYLARQLKPQEPPTLVLSMPRSGSSWVGETLGHAPNALYLREPISQRHLSHCRRTGREPTVVFDVDPATASPVYAQAAQVAFLGLPLFPPYVVKNPRQWGLGSRASRRLVIKEVNPRACAWLVGLYQPRVIFLVRHPAAVALSYARMGWTSRPIHREFGEHLGSAQRQALDSLASYPDRRFLTYEALCADPVGHFRQLFEFADLAWDSEVEAFIQRRTRGGGEAILENPYSTARDSQNMIRSWVGHPQDEELAEIRAGYADYDLPWYRSEDDWS